MTAVLVTLLILALVIYGLERNHRREIRVEHHLAGSGGQAADRDAERVLTEVRAVAQLRR